MTDPVSQTDVTVAERRAFGHLYRPKRSPYWWLRYRVAGKEHRESSHSTSSDVAEKLLMRRQVELGVPGAFVAPDTKRVTFDDLAQLVRTDYVVNGLKSADRLEDSLKRLGRVFAGVRARTITPDRLNRYVADRLAEKAAPQTVKNELGALHRAFVLGKRARKVAEVPEFPIIEVHNTRTGFFEEPDFRALLGELPEPLRPPLEFAYLTGWRVPSEVLVLRWAQVDLGAGMVRLEPGTTKNGEGRTFPFGALPPLKALLERQRELTSADERRLGAIIPFVFHREGRPIRDFHKVWRAACERAAHEGDGVLRQVVRPALLTAIPHDLRRTAVRNLVRAGVPEVIAMKLTGHLTRSVFDRYNIVNERDLAEGVTKLALLHSKTGT